MAGIDYNDPPIGSRKIETVCTIHRDIYRGIFKNPNITDIEKNYLINRIETAFKMVKSMDGKIRQYKNNYDDNWWEVNKRKWDWDELKGEYEE